MPITNYSELQNACQDWLNRQDLARTVTSFIALAEADLNRTLRARDMISDLPYTLSFNAPLPVPPAPPPLVIYPPDTAPLPPDFLEMRGAPFVVSTGRPLLYSTPELLTGSLSDACLTGDAMFYTLIGSVMRIAPAPAVQPAPPAAPLPTTDIAFFYYQRIPTLIEPTDTNWLLTKHPDLYLYSTLLQSAPYLKDDERVQIWGTAQAKLLEDIRMDTERASFRGATPIIRTAGGSIG